VIYLDNAATTIHKPESVTEAVVHAMSSFGNASRGTYGSALDAVQMVHNTRRKLAGMFGCSKPDHVVFTSNATEALNIAINGTLSPGDHVITTDLEHNSVLRPLYRLKDEKQISVDFVPADTSGMIHAEDIRKLITPATRAIICTHASNVTGNLVDLEEIGSIARENGLLFIADVSQTAGSIAIDMEKMNIDILCFTGHKGLMGPQGTGGLCIREGIEIRPWCVGGTGVHSYSRVQPEAYPARLEAGTLNSHGIAGLSAALDFIEETGLKRIALHENRLMRRFYNGVCGVDGVTVYGDFSQLNRTAVVSLNIRDYESGMIADDLSQIYGISVRPGAHCAPRMHEALGTTSQGVVRFSFSYFNTEDDVDQAILAVRELAL
jgi:cysteine desulfurase family protein